MKEKTFDELVRPHEKIEKMKGYISCQDAEKLMQQVCEAIKSEIESKANEYGEFGTADYVHDMPTDRIKLTENK